MTSTSAKIGLRDIIDHIDELRFRSQAEKHELSHLYEAKIKNMGNAGKNGGEYYTPRPLIRAMVEIIQPKVGERIYDAACGSAGFLCESFDYIDISSVSNSTFRIETSQRLKGKNAPSRARKLVRMNDILFATIRPTLQRIAIVPESFDQQICSTGYFVLRTTPEVDHRYLFYSLFTESFTRQMASLQKGASYPAVTDGEVKRQVISFPPLLEQQRIVRILEEAFEDINNVRANTEKSYTSGIWVSFRAQH